MYIKGHAGRKHQNNIDWSPHGRKKIENLGGKDFYEHWMINSVSFYMFIQM